MEEVLAETPLNTLPVPGLAQTLSELPGLGSLEPAKLQEALTDAIEQLKGEGADLGRLLEPGELVPALEAKLLELIPALGTLLGGSPGAKLTEALESASSSTVISELLSSASNPEGLIAQVLEALNPERLQALVGSVLDGEFARTAVGELASGLGESPEELDEGFKTNAEHVPSTAMALNAPLSDGETLGVLLPGLDGIHLGVLESSLGTPGGSGGSGSRGSGGSGTPGGGTTIVIEQNPSPSPGPSASSATGATAAAAAAAGKVKLISHKVKGKIATIVLQAPGAGKIALSGHDVKSVSRETDQAERVTLRATLAKAGAAAVRKHHQLKVKLNVSFKPVSGTASIASVTVAFK